MKFTYLALFLTAFLSLFAADTNALNGSQTNTSLYIKTATNDDILSKEERAWINAHPNITLASTEDYIHLASRDPQGKIVGFDADLIAQINKNLNINITLKLFRGWSEAYHHASLGAVDGILSLSKTPERESTFLFSPVYHTDPTYIITRKSEYGITSVADFNNKIIVTEENNIINELVQKEAPRATIVHAPSVYEIFQMIQAKKADGALLEGIENYNIDPYELKISGTLFTKSGEYTIGTHNQNPLLASIITKGIQSISKNQMEIMKKKWFHKLSNTALFSKEELEYIQNSPVIKIGIEDWQPVISTKDGKNIEGIVGELLSRVIQISGLRTELVAKKWNFLLEDFKEHKIDILPATYYTDERAKFGLYSDPYTYIMSVLYVLKENESIKSFSDLEGRVLAIQKGFGTIDAIRKKYPKITIVETASLQEAIMKVSNKEADALFEAQIVAQEYIQQLLITNLKPIFQNSIDESPLYFFSKKNDPILQSILNKALQSIPPQEKNNIIDKWLHQNVKRHLNIAFVKDNEPYSSDQALMKGIEHDIAKAVFEKSSMLTNYQKYFPQKEIQNALFDDQKLDAAVGVQEKNDGLYHSDPLFNGDIVAISRVDDNLNIVSIADLQEKSTIAFEGAFQTLDADFKTIFASNNHPKAYREIGNPEQLLNAFLAKESSVLIMDKNTFIWYLRKLHGGNLNQFKLHYIFQKNSSYEVAFKDKNTRDIFNKNLQEFKTTKEYSDIFYNYLYTDIEAKTHIGTLISALLAKAIFKEDIKKLFDTVVTCATLPYIQKIEVFNNEGELLVSHTKVEAQTPMRYDSFYYSLSNSAQKVGSVAIYFDDQKLESYTQSQTLIPNVTFFQHLSNYPDIKEVYKKFDYIDTLSFTKKEEEFIKKHPIIYFGAVKTPQLYMHQKDKAVGLYSDFIKLIEQKTGIIFRQTFATSKDDLYLQLKNQDVELIADTKDFDLPHLSGSILSDEFVNFKLSIISRNEGKFAKGLGEIQGNVAVARNSSAHTIMMNFYPHIPLIITQNSSDAMTLVSQGKANNCVGEEEELGYLLQDEFPQLKIIGVSQERIPHIFIANNIHPELISIINKILNMTPYEQQQNIKDQWFKTKINTEVDYSIVYKVAGTLLLIIFLGIIYNKRLQYLVEQKTFELEKLLISFDNNVIAAKIDANQHVIYVSEALSRISGYSREELEKNWFMLIDHPANRQGIKTLKKAFEQKLLWNGHFVNSSRSGTLFWTDSTLFPEYDGDGNFLYFTLISQDITAQKNVENLNKEIEDTQKEILFKMGAIAEVHSRETGAHVKRVAEYSYILAKAYGLSEEESNIIKLASPMHDIGKIGIPDSILNKDGPLTDEEFTIIKTHATLGYEMLKNSHRTILKASAIIAYEHHEKFNGTGYPRGLQGDDIHIYGRITAIADVYDALGSKRVYKDAWTDEAIFDHFRKEKGRHFDPYLVDLFFQNIATVHEIRSSFKDD